MIGYHGYIAHLKSVGRAASRSRAAGRGSRTTRRARIAGSRAAVIRIRARSAGSCARLTRDLHLVSNVGRQIIGISTQRINGSRGAIGQSVAARRSAQATSDRISGTTCGGAAGAALALARALVAGVGLSRLAPHAAGRRTLRPRAAGTCTAGSTGAGLPGCATR